MAGNGASLTDCGGGFMNLNSARCQQVLAFGEQ